MKEEQSKFKERLLAMSCPMCNKDLITNGSGSERLVGCENFVCGFVITQTYYVDFCGNDPFSFKIPRPKIK